MYQGNWGRAVLSRVVAVALLCLVAAWLTGELAALEAAETAKMSYEELRQYVQEGATVSFAERYLFTLIGIAVLVTLSEALAAGLRAVVPSVSESTESEPTSRTYR